MYLSNDFPKRYRGMGAYLSTDSTPGGGAVPKGTAGVEWWKQALSVGGDVFSAFLPQIKTWLGTASPTDQKSLTDAIAAMGIASTAQMAELQKAAQTQTWVMIGLLGAAVVGGFYFLNKKSRVVTPAVKVRA